MVASFDPPGWRRLTSAHRLSYRLVRDGFHGLCVLSGTRMVGIVPGAIVTLRARHWTLPGYASTGPRHPAFEYHRDP